MNKQIQCYLGVDWGRQCHQACVVNVAGEVLGNQSFVHSGEGMGQLVQWCHRLGGDEAQFAAAIETPHGPVVETLLALDFAVHAINPKQLSRFRDRHSPSGAKDDRRDARVLADALRTDPQAFRRLQPADKFTVQLRHRLRSYENLVEQRTRLNNQIQELLSSYYPQFLKVSRNLSLRWVLALWKKLPTPQKAKRVRVPTVERLLRKHGAKKKTAQELLEMLTQPALNRSDDCIAATVSEIRILVEILEVIQKNLKKVKKDLDQCLEEMEQQAATDDCDARPSDAAIIRSMPGAGRIVTATILAKAGDAVTTRNHRALRCLTGVAPVTHQSGKMHFVKRRRAADKQLSEAAYHLARSAIQHDAASRSQYQALRQRGHSHGRALRSVADRLLAIVCAMLRDGTLFEPRRGARQASPETA